jgi:hypothetical protein
VRAGVLSERGAPEQGAADGVKMMDERQESLAGYFFEHFNADFAVGNLSQSRDTGLVFALDFGGVACEHGRWQPKPTENGWGFESNNLQL